MFLSAQIVHNTRVLSCIINIICASFYHVCVKFFPYVQTVHTRKTLHKFDTDTVLKLLFLCFCSLLEYNEWLYDVGIPSARTGNVGK